MNIRFLAILTTLVFLGFSVHAMAGKQGRCKPWPSCNVGSSDGEELYNVVITINETLPTVSGGDYWQYDGKGVDYFWFQPDGYGELNLDYFRGHVDDGEICFGSFISELEPVPLFEAGLRKFKHGSALGRFWFDGKAKDGETEVLYMLTVTGHFDNDKTWPEEIGNKVHLLNWSIQAGGDNSCQGSEIGNSDFMTVEVFATSLP